MNFKLLGCFVILCLIVLVESSATKQSELNVAVESFMKNRNVTKINRKNKKTDRHKKSNMRTTSDKGKLINDLFMFAKNYTVGPTNNKIRIKPNITHNRHKRSTPVGSYYTISSAYCPYTSVTCNSSYIYRSYDGTCNNLVTNTLYGSKDTPYKRYLSLGYDDGTNSARQTSTNGSDLPNPRTISITISVPTSTNVLEFNITHLYALFGQFLTHDITGVSTSTDSDGTEIDCPCTSTDESCLGIDWPSNDAYLNQTCLNFTRSSAAFPSFDCTASYREQLNLVSSFIDGSQIYGLDSTRASDLRTFSGGLLKTSSGITAASKGITNRTYLPLSSDDTCSSSSSSTYYCFYAGEYRTSENLGLVGMHTLFNREHNRIAAKLAALNPTYSDETLYQETRRIVIAEYQHVVFNEFVPIISGNTSLSPLSTVSYYTGYDSTLNPALYNEFTTAAFRMGHSLIRQSLNRRNLTLNQIANGAFDLENIVFQSDYAYNTTFQGLNSIFVALISDLSWRFGSFGKQLQNNLFSTTYSNGTTTASDLLALNIQRGRDHGIAPYYVALYQCFGANITSFTDLTTYMTSDRIVTLKSLYASVYDIDLYVGGLYERKSNAQYAVGPTFACLIMAQFSDIKKSDRFYYENGPTTTSSAFSLSQLTEIKKVTLAGIICNNYDLTTITSNPFYSSSSDGNSEVSCSTLTSQMNLTAWYGTA